MSESTSESIDKAMLLEWLEAELKETAYESLDRETITRVILRIKRGTFDLCKHGLPPRDECYNCGLEGENKRLRLTIIELNEMLAKKEEVK